MVFIFEGMDNCLKDTIIQNLRQVISPETQVLKFSNPPKELKDPETYQKRHFKDMFDLLASSLAQSRRNLILNRAHLGEYVYSPIYRQYLANWIFELEKDYLSIELHSQSTILILLYDSDNEQLKLREDGKSFSKLDDEKIDSERAKFIEAFNKSLFPLKMKFDLKDFYIAGSDAKRKVDTSGILEEITSRIRS